MTILGSGRVTRRDWLAAAAMTAGLGLLLFAAAPSSLLASEDITSVARDWECLSADCSAAVGDGPTTEAADPVPESRTVRSG
jgi:hypothetical protein